MLNWKNISALYQHELSREFRNIQGLGSVFLYVFASTFIAYISFKTIHEVSIWNGIFWLMVLFASINSTSHSFKESTYEDNYLKSLCKAEELLVSKVLFNVSVLLVANLLCLMSYSAFLGHYILNTPFFVISSCVGSISLAVILTTTSAIAKAASGNSSLFSVLSLPIILPVLLLLITGSSGSLGKSEEHSFIHAEMYSDQEQTIFAEVIKRNDSTCTLMDRDGSKRTVTWNKDTLALNKNYVVIGTYLKNAQQFVTSSILPKTKESMHDSIIKISGVMVVSLLLLLISILLFPKFWTH